MLTLFSEASEEAVKVMVLVVPGRAVSGTSKFTATLNVPMESIVDLRKQSQGRHSAPHIGRDEFLVKCH